MKHSSSLFIFLWIFNLFFNGACGTQDKKKEGEIPREELATLYIKNIQAISPETKPNFSSCPKSWDSTKNLPWEKWLEMANACVLSKNWNRVEAIAQKISRETTHSPWGPYYLSLLAEEKGLLEKALWMSDLALKRSPKQGLLNYQKGRILWKMGQFDESFVWIERSVENGLRMPEAHSFLGKVFLRDRDLKLAEVHFERALSYQPEHFDSLVGISKVYEQQGNEEKEFYFLEKAKKIQPQSLTVQRRLSFLTNQKSQRAMASKEEKVKEESVRKKIKEGGRP